MTVTPHAGPDAVHVDGVTAWRDGVSELRGDLLAAEEPLEIRFSGLSVAVTMRTPGHDLELASGFLFTEGILPGPDAVAHLDHCPPEDGVSGGNVVNLNPVEGVPVDPGRWQRNFFTTSSCGICGKASIDAVRQDAPHIAGGFRMPARILASLDAALRRGQEVFSSTGGLHAAGLFSAAGDLLVLREDVGRHNAVDKVIGAALLGAEAGLHPPPLADLCLVVSGRTSFELVQKAWMAGIPLLAAVSAPSSLAVELARSAGITLAGFLRQGRFNLYSAPERIT